MTDYGTPSDPEFEPLDADLDEEMDEETEEDIDWDPVDEDEEVDESSEISNLFHRSIPPVDEDADAIADLD